MTHKTIVVFESDWEWMRIERDRLRADIELLRGANMELRGENVRLRAEVEEQAKQLVELRKALGDAIEWNWLDDDRPAHLFRMYLAMSALRGEGE